MLILFLSNFLSIQGLSSLRLRKINTIPSGIILGKEYQATSEKDLRLLIGGSLFDNSKSKLNISRRGREK